MNQELRNLNAKVDRICDKLESDMSLLSEVKDIEMQNKTLDVKNMQVKTYDEYRVNTILEENKTSKDIEKKDIKKDDELEASMIKLLKMKEIKFFKKNRSCFKRFKYRK